MTSANNRSSDLPVDPLFLERWSPRAFDGQPLSDEQVMTLFEAARWAPSSSNVQPWRFIYAKRDTPHWEKFLNLLIPFNQSWAKNASLLIIVASNSMTVGKDGPAPSLTHSFDAGAAWASLAFQATKMGLQAHGMAGFDYDRAFAELGVPTGYRVEAAIAVGRPGDKSILPEALQAREIPNDRQPLTAMVFEGGFKA